MSDEKKKSYLDYDFKNQEAPYQAAKTNIQSEIDEIHKATKANGTRLLEQKVTMRPDWDLRFCLNL
jgi:hypothetical protein